MYFAGFLGNLANKGSISSHKVYDIEDSVDRVVDELMASSFNSL